METSDLDNAHDVSNIQNGAGGRAGQCTSAAVPCHLVVTDINESLPGSVSAIFPPRL